MGDLEQEVPPGTCLFCGAETLHISLEHCRECLRNSGDFSDITKNRETYWNWKMKNDYLSPEEKKLLRKKLSKYE